MTIAVQGLGPAGLPFEFGGIRFEQGSEELGTRIAERIVALEPKKRVKASVVSAENEKRNRDRDELARTLAPMTLAFMSVLAVDFAAARALAVAALRRTVDALNFFSPFLEKLPVGPRRVYQAPEGSRTSLFLLAYPEGGEEFYRAAPDLRPNLPVDGIDLASADAVRVGVPRASVLLGDPKREEFGERITNAIVWAGRARAELRRDQAFLLNAIALEALLTKSGARSGVTDRIVIRTAHLIGRTAEAKRSIFDQMRKLYELRSAIVHTGDSGELADSDIDTISMLVNRALTIVLTDKRFTVMRAGKEFDAWFDGQLFA